MSLIVTVNGAPHGLTHLYTQPSQTNKQTQQQQWYDAVDYQTKRTFWMMCHWEKDFGTFVFP